MKQTNVNPLEGDIIKGMIRLAVPMVLVQALSMVFSIADSLVIANFGSSLSMGSIGETSNMITLLLCLVSGLSVGVSVTVGIRLGEGNADSVKRLMNTLVPSAFVIGLFVCLIAILLARPLMLLIDCPEQLIDGACLYLQIYALSIPFYSVFLFLSSSLQAKGDTVRPLYFQTAAGILNVLLNLLFVIVFGWDIAGVAIATVISQALCAAACLFYMCSKEEELRVSLCEMSLFKEMSDVTRIGLTTCLSSVVMDIAGILIIRGINSFGDLAAVGSAASSTIEGLMALAFVGLGSACGIYVAQNYGARNFDRIKKAIRSALLLCFVLGEVMGLAVYALGPYVLGFFINESESFTADMVQESLAAGLIRLKWLGLLYGFCGTMNVLNGGLRSIDEPKAALWISLLCSGVLRVSWIFISLQTIHTLDALFIAFPACWVLMTGLELIVFVTKLRKKEALA